MPFTDNVQNPKRIGASDKPTERNATTYTKQKYLPNHTNQPTKQTNERTRQTDELNSHYNRPGMHLIF